MSSVSELLSVNFCLFPDLAPNWKNKFAAHVTSQLLEYNVECVVTEVGSDILQSLHLVIEDSSSEWIALVSKQIKLFPKAFGSALEGLDPTLDTAVLYSDSLIPNQRTPFTGERPDYSPERPPSHTYRGPQT